MRRSWSRRAAAAAAVAGAVACGPGGSRRDTGPGADLDALPPGADLRLGDPRWRVPGSVDAIVFSPDEREVVVGSQDGGVLVLDVATGRRRARIGDLGSLGYLARLDAERVIAGGWIVDDGASRPGPPTVIDVRAGRVEHRPALARLAAGEIATADDELIVDGARPERLRVVGVDGTFRRELDRSRGYGSLATGGGRVLAVRGYASVGVWDRTTGARLVVFGAGNGGLAALSPDGTHVALGTWSQPLTDLAQEPRYELDVHRVDGGAKVVTLVHPCHYDAAAFSPDGARLVVACDSGAWVHALPSGDVVATLPATGDYVRVAAWAPSGRWLALGGNDATVHLVDTATWHPVALGPALGGEVRALDVTADGRLLATGAIPGTGSIDVWDAATGRRLEHLSPAWAPRTTEMFSAAALGAPGELVVARARLGLGQGTVLERRAAGAPATTVAVPAGGEPSPEVGPIRVRADGTIVVVGGGAIRVLGPDLAPVRTWTLAAIGGDPILPRFPDVALARDGSRAAVETRTGVELIDLEDPDAPVRRIEAEVCGSIVELAFTADQERLIAIGGDGGVYRLDATTGKVAAGIVLPARADALAWLPSGEVVLLAGDELYAWARSGEVRRGRVPDVTALGAAPSGQHLYLGIADGTIVRVRWSALRDRLEPTSAPAAGACEESDDDVVGGLIGNLGDSPRGVLDNTQPHEDPIDAE
jgi:WD40 repeat protein